MEQEQPVQVGRRLAAIVAADVVDDIEIRPIGLENKEIAHGNRRFKNDVGNIEIVGNHHQVRGRAVAPDVLQDPLLIHRGLTVG